MPRNFESPRRYDRAELRRVLETEGLDAALARWPKGVVVPIARLLGLYGHYRQSDIWNPEWVKQLGTKPDQILAAEWGIAGITVSRYRRELGIKAQYTAHAYVTKIRRERLAQIPDAILAQPIAWVVESYGVPARDVVLERRLRGVRAESARGRKRNRQSGDLRRVAINAIYSVYPDVTLEEVGAALGCTRERIRQLRQEIAVNGDLRAELVAVEESA